MLGRFNEQGRIVGPHPGPKYAPHQIAEHPDANGVSKKDLADAMQRLLDGGKISIQPYGPPSKQRFKLVVRR